MSNAMTFAPAAERRSTSAASRERGHGHRPCGVEALLVDRDQRDGVRGLSRAAPEQPEVVGPELDEIEKRGVRKKSAATIATEAIVNGSGATRAASQRASRHSPPRNTTALPAVHLVEPESSAHPQQVYFNNVPSDRR